MALKWKNKWKWSTGYSADSVEWCPVEGYHDVLVCGTYQLSKDDETAPKTKQTRLGKIYLFIIEACTQELSPIQTPEVSGVLDQKWCYHDINGHPVLGVVTSEGTVQLYRLARFEDKLIFELWIEESIGQEFLALSLDWSSNKYLTDPCLVVSDSSGSVTIMKVLETGLEKTGVWKSHGFEAWIGAFNYWNPDIFYSGGDDCLFKGYDTRVPDCALVTNKSHEAGVTSIRSHIEVEHQILTGSYDEKVRLWDSRNLKRCLIENNVNGGVWRLKWCPYESKTILAACMYGGFRLLRAENEEISIVQEYLAHESIAYGADWKFDKDNPLVATCSFYDCQMHVSEIVNLTIRFEGSKFLHNIF